MAEKNGTWTRVSLAVMGAITLLSAGFAACSTTVAVDYRRLDQQGTQKAQALETRVTKLETTLDVVLKGVQDNLKDLNDQFRKHMVSTGSGVARSGSGG
jgi:predicted secreted acid phosphatase